MFLHMGFGPFAFDHEIPIGGLVLAQSEKRGSYRVEV